MDVDAWRKSAGFCYGVKRAVRHGSRTPRTGESFLRDAGQPLSTMPTWWRSLERTGDAA